MNKKQEDALKKLSLAFKACGKVKISFVGMDHDINAYDADELEKAQEGCDLYDAQMKCGQGTHINTYKTYLDSGGW